MSWAQATEYLEALGVDAMKALKPSLHRIEALCESLDHPERRIPAIHIAGTNGKTSTARIATSLLSAAGLSVGTFTSPHLSSVRERITHDGLPISPGEFGEVFDHLYPYLELVEGRLGEKLSYFEVLTAMFFLWAVEAPVDAAVIEVGLGGRWDATNVVPAPCGVLTAVSLDHTDLLGTDLAGIAREKSGIAKRDAAFVCGERDPALQDVVQQETQSAGAVAALIGRDFDVIDSTVAVDGRAVSVRTSTTRYEDLFLPLHGSHQAVNAAVALEAVSVFLPARELDAALVQEGFGAVSVPGRMESLRAGTARVVLDVAHNPDGMQSLVNALGESFAYEEVIGVVGFLREKDFRGMLSELATVTRRLVVTEPATPRARPVEEVERAAVEEGFDVIAVTPCVAAVRAALEMAGPHDIVAVTGSHYVVGEARTHLLEQTASTA